jgi:hypothetical protein
MPADLSECNMGGMKVVLVMWICFYKCSAAIAAGMHVSGMAKAQDISRQALTPACCDTGLSDGGRIMHKPTTIASASVLGWQRKGIASLPNLGSARLAHVTSSHHHRGTILDHSMVRSCLLLALTPHANVAGLHYDKTDHELLSS